MTRKTARLSALAFAFLIALGSSRVAAAPSPMWAEIQRLENALASSVSPAERRAALVGLASLRQLSGNFAAAAGLWLEAAALDPADDRALVMAAYSLAATGEWERALATAQPVLASGRRGPHVAQARYLDATLRAWIASDITALVALAGDPEAAFLRPTVYYTLWWTELRDPVSFGGNAERWKGRLLALYPQSPEARIVAETGDPPTVSAVHSPLWLLLPGAASSALEEIPLGSTLAGLIASPGAAGQPAGPVAQQQATRAQQTGLFRNEANALAHAQVLRLAGFDARVSRRLVNGAYHWAVLVPTRDAARTALELRIAGHDSFTVAFE